MFKQFEEQQEA